MKTPDCLLSAHISSARNPPPKHVVSRLVPLSHSGTSYHVSSSERPSLTHVTQQHTGHNRGRQLSVPGLPDTQQEAVSRNPKKRTVYGQSCLSTSGGLGRPSWQGNKHPHLLSVLHQPRLGNGRTQGCGPCGPALWGRAGWRVGAKGEMADSSQRECSPLLPGPAEKCSKAAFRLSPAAGRPFPNSALSIESTADPTWVCSWSVLCALSTCSEKVHTASVPVPRGHESLDVYPGGFVVPPI